MPIPLPPEGKSCPYSLTSPLTAAAKSRSKAHFITAFHSSCESFSAAKRREPFPWGVQDF